MYLPRTIYLSTNVLVFLLSLFSFHPSLYTQATTTIKLYLHQHQHQHQHLHQHLHRHQHQQKSVHFYLFIEFSRCEIRSCSVNLTSPLRLRSCSFTSLEYSPSTVTSPASFSSRYGFSDGSKVDFTMGMMRCVTRRSTKVMRSSTVSLDARSRGSYLRVRV